MKYYYSKKFNRICKAYENGDLWFRNVNDDEWVPITLIYKKYYYKWSGYKQISEEEAFLLFI